MICLQGSYFDALKFKSLIFIFFFFSLNGFAIKDTLRQVLTVFVRSQTTYKNQSDFLGIPFEIKNYS